MKNAGVGVGLPDFGRALLKVVDGKLHIRSGASCIGQGLGTVLVQVTAEVTGLSREQIACDAANTINAPDSGTTSGSRQTLITGEAVRRACELLKEDLKQQPLDRLEGKEYYGEYLAKTDPLGADVPNPVSHVAYGYATQVCILNEQGKIEKIAAAHDVGKAVNPLSVEGQIEGGVVMSMGFALTEEYALKDCVPQSKFGTLGLFRAHEVPDVESIIVEKPGLAVAGGAIGIGEITSIPTAPAIAGAYYRFDGQYRTSLPLADTPYARSRKHPQPAVHTEGVPFIVRGSKRDREAGNKEDGTCIACGICAKNCPSGAIAISGARAHIQEERCLSCGMCVVKCPKDAIYDVRGIIKK